jgi:DNA-binding NtrC family response regulator
MTAASKPPARATGVTILFVDDEPAVTRAVSRVVAADTGFRVFTAASGQEAIEVLRSWPIDVLVSDIDMPQMNGLDLVRVARREFPSTLRILLTGAVTMDRAIAAVNEGEVVRIFTKPFDIKTFSHALNDLGERILRLRQERHADAQRERCDELFRWIEERYPGSLDFERSESGEVVIDVVRLRAYLDTAPSEVRSLAGAG